MSSDENNEGDNRNIPSAVDQLSEEEYIKLLLEYGYISEEESEILLKAEEERKKNRKNIEIPF